MRTAQAAALFDLGGPDAEWIERAACTPLVRSGEMTVDDFFPTPGMRFDRALAVCAACPVREECLTYALVAAEKVGIWGGQSELERRRTRRRRKRSAA